MLNDIYSSIVQELTAEPAALTQQSATLQDIFMYLEVGSVETAINLVPELDDVEYERNRTRIAELANVRPAKLDEWRKRAMRQGADGKLQGRELTLKAPQPADEPQNGARLLDDIVVQIRRFIAADASSIDAMALWAVFAHIADKAAVCPNLAFVSATKACGKSTALDVVSRLVPRSVNIANVTPSALFRVIEATKPSLIIDEADVMFKQNEELRCLLNAGFTRSAAQVLRTVGDDFEPRIFTVWCPKTFALIGFLPSTLESRSVVIHMRRRLPDEAVERLRSDRDQGFEPLASRIARFVLDNAEAILADEPELPQSLSDRQADVWRELCRIADIAGGEWPKRARTAALELCAKSDDEGDLSIRLLADIQRIMGEQEGRTRWPSQALADALNGLDESPWADMNYGKGLTTNRLAKMLARFDIHTKQLREGTKGAKGYLTETFIDAFARYLPTKRNNETLCDNSLSDNKIECFGSVSVSDAKRNIEDNETSAVLERALSNEELVLGSSIANEMLQSSRKVSLEDWRKVCAQRGLDAFAINDLEHYLRELGLTDGESLQDIRAKSA